MSKQFWIALAVIIVLLGGVLVVTNHGKQNTVSSKGTPTNHVEGTSPAGVTLVEYGDYQCPVCATFYSTVKQVAAKYSDKVVFQFRNLPLVSIHQNAFAGARAAEAAGMQNKFWEMNGMLYTGQSDWVQSSDPLKVFDTYAQTLGLNVSKFNTDYASDAANNAINADVNAFNQTGDDMATPTFYLGGKKVSNTQLVSANGTPSVDAFSKILDAELAKKTAVQK